METKMIRVPFEVELAKKITEKSVDGKIVTRDGRSVRITCFDAHCEDNIVALVEDSLGLESTLNYLNDGKFYIGDETECDLFIEIPEYMTFKEGDVIAFDGSDVLILCAGCIRKIEKSIICEYYALIDGDIFRIVPKGCEFELINSRFATESEKQKLIDALKASKEPKTKEYLKRFFNIEVKPECEFKPFDKVLVRNNQNESWRIEIFSRIDKSAKFLHVCSTNIYSMCIPYNKQTAHLLGTTENYE